MRKILTIFFLFLFFVQCKKENTVLPPLTTANISAVNLWKRITVEQNYKKYAFWPGHEGEQPGQSPHGNYHFIYISPVLRNALPISDQLAPDGSIIVKLNCDANKNAKVITAMAKVKGYDPENNDWFWVRFDLDGTPLAEGKLDGCINCHSLLKKNDYIFIRQLDKELTK